MDDIYTEDFPEVSIVNIKTEAKFPPFQKQHF